MLLGKADGRSIKSYILVYEIPIVIIQQVFHFHI